jgi:signal transduction histidine kinase
VSVVTANAVAAGATRLAIRIASDDASVSLVVTDDAGGFDLDEVPAGRGLWQLREELDGDAINVDDIDGGSVVSVRIGREVGVHGPSAAR